MNITKHQRFIPLLVLLATILLGHWQQISAQPSVTLSLVSAESDADAGNVVLPSPALPLSIAYPDDALRGGIGGLVRLRVLFDEAEVILQTESIDSAVNKGLLYAAVSGLEKMEFNPGKIDGEMAGMWVIVQVNFSIEEDYILTMVEAGTPELRHPDPPSSKESEESNAFPDFVPNATPPSYDDRELLSYLQYPPEAQNKGLEGTVYIKVSVDTEGNLRNIRVVHRGGIDSDIFDEASLKAVRQTKFSPAIIKGEPVEMSVTIPIRFHLAE